MDQRSKDPGPSATLDARSRAYRVNRVESDAHRYRTLCAAIDDGFCVVEMLFDAQQKAVDYRFIEANTAFHAQTGLQNVVGRTMRELVPDLDDKWFETYGRVATTGVPERFALEAAAMNRWFDVFAFRVGGESNAHVAILFADVTARKQSEAALKESEESFRALADASPAMLWVNNVEGKCTFLSRVWSEFTGQSSEDGRGFGWLDVIHPDDAHQCQQNFLLANVKRKPFEHVYRLRRADNEYRWCLDLGRPRYSATGDYLGQVGLVLDVTERTLAERALRDTQARLEATLEVNEVATWTWDIQHDRVFADRNLAQLFSVSPEDAAGGPLETYLRAVHPRDRDRVRASIHTAVATKQPYESAYRVCNADGQYRSLVARGRVECAEDGHPLKMPGVVLDVTRQEKAESLLRESEQRYRNLFNTIDEGFCVIEKIRTAPGEPIDFRYVEANPAFVKQSGVDVVVGSTIRELFGDDSDNWSPFFDAVLESGTSTRFERELTSVGRVLEVYAFVADAVHQRVGVIFKDIGLRKRAERELKESEERFRILVGQVKDFAIFRTDVEGRNTSWNEGVRRVLGFEEAEFVGVDVCSIIFTPEDIATKVPERQLQDAIAHGRSDNERWMRNKDGQRFWATGVTTALFDEHGGLLGFTKVLRDQTDLKRNADTTRFLSDAGAALVELVDYESTLHRIANLAVAGFADGCIVEIVDEDGQHRRFTSARSAPDDATTLLTSAEQQLSLRVERDPRGMALALCTGRSELVSDLRHARMTGSAEEGEYFDVLDALGVRSYICVPLWDRGKVTGCITFLTDGSGRHYSEHELRAAEDLGARVSVALENARLYKALQDADRRKDEFLATLAHELRNPLAPIRTGLQVLQMADSRGETAARAQEMMNRQLAHMVRLVDDLLDVSRVSRGRVELRRERITLQAVIENAIETSRPLIDASQHKFSSHVPSEPIWLDADLTRLAQVVSNILTNAAKYTPQGGEISLDARSDGAWAVISITDTGAGLPKEMLGKVFEMFAQVNKTLTRSQGGLGIGLALVKSLLEMHGGTITASSPGIDQGSTFTVRLPRLECPQDARAPNLQRERVSAHEHRRVLVVDDNHDGAEALALMLELSGHETQTAFDGLHALAAAKDYEPDVVFLDIGLPQLNGYEVAKRMRAEPRLQNTVLVALTGWGSDDDKRRSRDAGFDFHLTKPVDPSAVQKVLSTTFQRARSDEGPSRFNPS